MTSETRQIRGGPGYEGQKIHDETTKPKFLCEVTTKLKYLVDILDFFQGTEKILRPDDGSPAESEPKKLFLKTHLPHPGEFLRR